MKINNQGIEKLTSVSVEDTNKRGCYVNHDVISVSDDDDDVMWFFQEFVDNFPTKCSVAGVSLETFTCYTS